MITPATGGNAVLLFFTDIAKFNKEHSQSELCSSSLKTAVSPLSYIALSHPLHSQHRQLMQFVQLLLFLPHLPLPIAQWVEESDPTLSFFHLLIGICLCWLFGEGCSLCNYLCRCRELIDRCKDATAQTDDYLKYNSFICDKIISKGYGSGCK